MNAVLGRAGENLADGGLHQIEGLVVAELGSGWAVIPLALDDGRTDPEIYSGVLK